MPNNTARPRRRKRASAIAQRVLPLQQAPHATIDVSLAARTDQPRAGEAPIMCAACSRERPCGGAAIVTIVPISDEAKRTMPAREDLVPLCADCLASPIVADAVARHFYPDLRITEGGNIPTQ